MSTKGILHTCIHSLESLNRKFTYQILRLFLRNKPHNIPINPDKVKRVLLFRYDAIGDMVVTTAAIDLLHQKLKHVEVDVLASEYNQHIVRHNKQFKNIFIHGKNFLSTLKLIREVRSYKYDAVFCFVLFKTTYAGLLANVLAGRNATKVTILFEERKKLYDVFFNVHIPLERDKCTMAELQARMLCNVFGWDYNGNELSLSIPLGEDNLYKAQLFLSDHHIEHSEKFVIYNISAGREYREFSVEKSVEIIQGFAFKFPFTPIVIVAIAKDVPKAERIRELSDVRHLVIFNSNDILDVCAIVQCSTMVVSPDTSLIHIASAYKKPIVAFYSEMTTYIYEWMPFAVPYRFLVAPDKLEIEHIPTDECYNTVIKHWEETIQ